MAGSEHCDELRGAVSALALGMADGEERALVLEHVVECPDCRQELEQLSAVADELLLLAPEQEPPIGFELRTLQALQPTRRPRRWRWRPARVLPALAAAALAAVVTAGGLLHSFRDERDLAARYRATLAQAHGSSFTAVPVTTTGGATAGTMFVYRGSPSWILLTVSPPHRASVDRAEMVTTYGRTVPLPAFRLADGSWGGAITVDAWTVSRVRVLGSNGKPLLIASLPTRW